MAGSYDPMTTSGYTHEQQSTSCCYLPDGKVKPAELVPFQFLYIYIYIYIYVTVTTVAYEERVMMSMGFTGATILCNF